MENPKKELIEEIVDLFQDYQEEYVPGEWEVFSEKRKKRAFVIPLWMRVAAVLIIIGGVLPFVLKTYKSEQHVKVLLPAKKNIQVLPAAPGDGNSETVTVRVPGNDGRIIVQHEAYTNTSTAAKTGAKQKLVADASVKNKSINSVLKNEATEYLVTGVAPQATTERVADKKGILVNSDQNGQLATVVIPSKEMLPNIKYADSVKKENLRNRSTLDFLTAESKHAVQTSRKKEQGSKWDFGIEVAPTATRENVNVGGGLTTAYRLSDKFSLSSGISLLQLEAGKKGLRGPGLNMAVDTYSPGSLASGSKELRAVNSNLKAIDIPVSIIYKFNDTYYTSAGVSYFNVISEKRNNTYVQTSSMVESKYDSTTGSSYFSPTLVSKESDEATSDTPLRGNSYLGFFNFSIGRRQNLFNKYNILIEPFIKVPIGKLSNEDLRLMNSGVKFQLSF